MSDLEIQAITALVVARRATAKARLLGITRHGAISEAKSTYVLTMPVALPIGRQKDGTRTLDTQASFLRERNKKLIVLDSVMPHGLVRVISQTRR